MPKLDERLKELITQPVAYEKRKLRKEKVTMRYAAYMRISSEEQVGNYSIDAQQRAIRAWVQAQGGQLVKEYVDEAKSARTTERPAFQQMRQDARNRKFDALVVHKFDRFARNRTDALAIKSLLRYDYGIKVFSVCEPSEDSDGPIGALIEGIMECVAEWYSRNLGTEISKGKREKGAQGLHNNNAPFGYKRDGKYLVPNPKELPGLRMVFETYATGKYSYTDLARLLNEHGYKSTSGRPFSKEAVRGILRNKIYIGKVKHQETRYNSQGHRIFSATIQWFDGQHEPLIEVELFERCQSIRGERVHNHQPRPKYNPYLLRGLVYCYHCCAHQPENADFRSWGKMYVQRQGNHNYLYYRCSTRNAGFACHQQGVKARTIDQQVVPILAALKPPENWRKQITKTIGEILGEQSIEQRLAEIRATIERMDFRWDNGFITEKTDYLEKRLRLQQELEQLTPMHEDLETAVDLLERFSERYAACNGDVELQHQLLKLIVERVYVQGERVVALTLKSDFHVVLGHNKNEPTFVEVDPFLGHYTHMDAEGFEPSTSTVRL